MTADNPKDNDFLKKILDDTSKPPKPYVYVHPSDIDFPPTISGATLASLLDVPPPIGKMIGDVVAYGKQRVRQTGNDEWSAMVYDGNPHLGPYLREVGFYNGLLLLVKPPPCADHYVCLTTKGLQALQKYFPAKKAQ